MNAVYYSVWIYYAVGYHSVMHGSVKGIKRAVDTP